MKISSVSPDPELVQHVLSGQQEAVRILIERYQGKLMSFLSKRGAAHADNQDILQETFISAFSKISTFDTTRSFSAWIFGIARNKANSHYRKVVPISPLDEQEKAAEAVDEASPWENLDEQEQSSLFWTEAKRLLNEDQFSALWLQYQQSLSINEISSHLAKSVSNTKILLFRARKTLSQSSLLAQHFHQKRAAL